MRLLVVPLLLAASAHAAVKVDIAADGTLSVRQVGTGRLWRSRTPPEPPVLGLPRLAAAPTLDGRADDWPGAPLARVLAATADQPRVDGEADCSAELRAGWTDAAMYLCLSVRDDELNLPAEPTLRWWDRDSAEVWLGGTQIGFSVTPAGGLASRVTEPADDCRVAFAVALLPGGFQYAANTDPPRGYVVEAAVPWSRAAPAVTPEPGAALPFAVGVNDADSGPREGQVYYPATWVHSQPRTFARAVLCGPDGAIPAGSRDRPPRISAIERTAGGVRFVAEGDRPGEAVTVTAAEQGDAVVFTIDTPDHAAPLERPLAYPPPLTSDLADGQICLAPYGNGLLLPQTNDRYRGYTNWGSGADLPFVGLTDGPTGDGYVMILETPYDGGIQLTPIDGKLVPAALWRGRLGQFGEPRRVRLEFLESGGYVACAKRYRAYAQRTGLLVTLREKKRLRPAVSRLAGAPNVWGGGASWAAEARRLGVQAALVNSEEGAPSLARINALGYLTSRYDNYVDLLEETDPAKWNNNHGPLDHVARHADGSLHMGWLTWDKQTQYYQRRSERMRAAAEPYIGAELAEKPYLGRFLDVTTAMDLVECYHPDATYGREQDARNKIALFEYVNSRNLVTGGEHGRSWAVPTMDYFEGMMSLNPHFSWPAGHLLKPENGLAGISDEYRAYGLGPALRIPLWELVFHDCVVDYWYWGDTNGYLEEFDPSLSDRKDAFNVLYGTPPMYWATRLDFGWDTPAGRRRTLRSYRHTGPWHGEVMFEEMTGHEYLSADRMVQRTTFAGGFEATVNFAGESRAVTVAGQELTLPPHGFAARGPRFLAERRAAGGGLVTRLRSRRLAAVDATEVDEPQSVPGVQTDGLCTVLIESPERLRIAQGGDAATINPAALVEGWDTTRMRLFELDDDGARQRALPLEVLDGKVRVDPQGRWLELATGGETALADLVVESLSLTPEALEQGRPAEVTARLRNAGWAPIAGGRARLEIDGLPWAEQPLDMAPQTELAVAFELDTSTIDGARTISVIAEPGPDQAEQLTANNRAEQAVEVAIDWRRWPRVPVARFQVTCPAVAQEDAEVAAALRLPEGTDPASVRVLEAAGGRAVPSQFENSLAAPLDGNLVWRVPGRLEPGDRRDFDVIAQRGDSGLLKPAGGYWDTTAQRVVTPVYSVDLADGVPRDWRLRVGDEPDRPAVRQMVYSSADTGWVDENGSLERIDPVAEGPVRTVLRVERRLLAGQVRYTRTFWFYADRFEVETRARPSVTGLHHRLYFTRGGTCADSLGRIAALDGSGDAESMNGQEPAWVAVYSPAWALSLVRLAGGGGLVWWDASNLGGLGYQGQLELSRDVFGFRPGQTAPVYAALDAARWRNPLVAERVEVR